MAERFEFTLTWRGYGEDEEHARRLLREFAEEHCAPTILEETVRPVAAVDEEREDG